ncbi:hypothetical protein PybrP1_003606 [[Pythium] brassicae (nom. inval.)]|nr:hypothetical protein PybrP1_003606 [[Pythium] brassicae (nom. inval.)]
MSFADFAGGNSSAVAHNHNHNHNGGFRGVVHSGDVTAGLSSKSRLAIDGATLKLEQFNRQVLAIKRAANAFGGGPKGRGTAGAALDDDPSDRIRFACLLQEELAKALRLIPQESASALLKKKLCKDFEAISNQLEAAVVQISAQEQAIQSALVAQSQDADRSGRIVAEHQGQVIEFQELENEIAHNEALIEEREKDIDKIHQSVAQVQEIFRDLAAIVGEQQTAIDEIETNVHDTLDKTQRGRDEVQKAADMQSRCVIQ